MHTPVFSSTVGFTLALAVSLTCQFSACAAPGIAQASTPVVVARVAENSANETTCNRTITIAASPLGRSMVISPEGKITGATKVFFDLIAKDTACVFEYIIVPRARAWHMLDSGQIDLVADATRSPERDRVAQFFEVGKTRPVLISLPGRVLKHKTVEQLIDSPITLITFNGHYWGQAYSDLLTHPKMQGRISSIPSPDIAVKMLLSGRADAILTGQAVILDAWEKSGGNTKLNISVLEELPALTYGLYMSKDKMSEHDRTLIEAATIARIKSGDLAKIVSNYYPAWAIYHDPSSESANKKSEKTKK